MCWYVYSGYSTCFFLWLSTSLFSSGLLALSSLQAPDRPQSLGCACGRASTEATARPSDPGQTKDLCSLHKSPQVSLQRDVTKSHSRGASDFRPLLEFHTIWDPCKTDCKLLWESLYLFFAGFKGPLTNSFFSKWNHFLTPRGLIRKKFIKTHAVCSFTSSSNKVLLNIFSVPVDVMPMRHFVCT